jgi:hypothetical protein
MPGSSFTLFLVERIAMTIASRTEITAAAIAAAVLFISGGAGGGGRGVDHGREFNSLSMEVRIFVASSNEGYNNCCRKSHFDATTSSNEGSICNRATGNKTGAENTP